MRATLLLILMLAGCRSGLLTLDDEVPASIDLERAPDDLASLDLASHDLGPVCSPANPKGECADGTTCCAYSCWGGSDEKGWCYPGPGCPAC